jgi:hypothetical protein
MCGGGDSICLCGTGVLSASNFQVSHCTDALVTLCGVRSNDT